jgi:hypothetical protein
LIKGRAGDIQKAMDATIRYGKNETRIETENLRRGAYVAAQAKANEYNGPWRPGNCSGCGQKGHWKRECPSPHLWKQNSKEEQKIDTAIEETRNKSGGAGQVKAGGGAVKNGGRQEN